MRVVTVLQTRALNAFNRGGSEFKASHVQALQRQVEKWAPFASFECLSDIEVEGVKCRKLAHDWPGWWSKLNLFDPEIKGDFLFMDLDTVITGSLDDFEKVKKLTVLRDFYRDGKKFKEGIGGGLMFLPEAARHQIWDEFITNPTLHMRLNSRGDQHFFEHFWLNKADRWQDVLPNQVVSWKVHCANGVPPEAKVVCFHGQPRPFACGPFLHLYRE